MKRFFRTFFLVVATTFPLVSPEFSSGRNTPTASNTPTPTSMSRADQVKSLEYKRLAEEYLNGSSKTSKNVLKAIHYYEQSAGLNNTDAMLSLAKIYAHGDGVVVNPQKARSWISKIPKNMKDERVNEILIKADGFKILHSPEMKSGKIGDGHPPFPRARFIIEETSGNGVTINKSLMLNPNGTFTVGPRLHPPKANESNNNIKYCFDHYFDPDDETFENVSPTCKWIVSFCNDPDPEMYSGQGGARCLKFKNTENKITERVVVPICDNAYGFLGGHWNPQKDLFYFKYFGGNTTSGDHQSIVQFDPLNRTFIDNVATGHDLAISPDGKWILVLFESSHDKATRYITACCVENSKQYVLGTEHTIVGFDQWAEPNQPIESIDKAKEITQDGIKLYRSKKYREAIQAYLKSHSLDPQNDENLGYLGYSLFLYGESKAARRALECSLKINPNNHMSSYNLVLVLWSLNEKNAALDHLDKLLVADKKYQETVCEDVQFKHILRSDEFKKRFTICW